MYVDPLLLAALLALLVVSAALAVMAYARYRRCEAVYEAYGRSLMEARPSEPESRYVSGADFAASFDEPPESPPFEAPVAEPPVAEQPAENEAPVERPHPEPLLPEPEIAVPPPVWEGSALPPCTAPGAAEAVSPAPDTLFYEYTAEGFVPIDPYEAPYLPATHSGYGLEEWEPVEALLAPQAARETKAEKKQEPALKQAPAPPRAADSVAAVPEDGFVWL